MKLFIYILLTVTQAWAFRVQGEGLNREEAIKNAFFKISIEESFHLKGLGGLHKGINAKDIVLLESESWVTDILKVSCVGRRWVKCTVKGKKQKKANVKKPILPLVQDFPCSKLGGKTKRMAECWSVQDERKIEQAGYWFWKGNLVFLNSFQMKGEYVSQSSKTFPVSAVGRSKRELKLVIEETILRKRVQWLGSPERLNWLNQNAHKFLLFEAASY